MKRYNPEYTGESHDSSIDMEESDDGEWVRFEDAQKEIAIEISNTVTICNRQAAKDMAVVGVECNCLEQVSQILKENTIENQNIEASWICPAHGYKKL